MMISVKNLNKYFNKGKNNQIHVINNTTLDLPKAGFISFLGPSGCGKTTLFNVIGGLDKQNSGTIVYDDVCFDKYNMSKVDKYRAYNIGYVFQNYNLLLDETVYENLRVALEIIGVTEAEEVKKRIEYTLKAVKMYKYRKKLAGTLSGGEQQRVSIARALLKNSRIILADEPTGNLDSANTLEVMSILKKISSKTLVLLVTHDSNLAEFYSDQIINIVDGKVENIVIPDNNISLNSKDDNVIYLKDNKFKQIDSEDIKVKLYHSNDDVNIEFVIAEKNGTYYLKSNKKIKLIDDTNIVLVDDHHKEIVKEDKEFEYDTSWYKDEKEKGIFRKIFKMFVNPIKSFFNVRKRTKFFHFAFFCIGIIFALLNISYVRYNYVDLSSITDDDDSYAIGNSYDLDVIKSSEVLSEANKAGYLRNLYIASSTYIDIEIVENSISSKYYYYQATIYPISLLEGHDILVGSLPTKGGEYVIGKKLADQIITDLESEMSYEELFNTIRGNSYNIVGITEKETSEVYVYENYFSPYDNLIYTNGDYNYGEMYYKYEKGKYSIVAGRDITDSDVKKCIVYVEDGLDQSEYNKILLNNERVRLSDGNIYEVVGLFVTKNYRLQYTTIATDLITSDTNLYLTNHYKNNYEIVEGRDLENDYEILIPGYNSHKVGDKIDKYTVVGKYNVIKNNDDDGVFSHEYVITTDRTIDVLSIEKILEENKYSHNSIEFQVTNYEEMEKLFSKNGMVLELAKDVKAREYLDMMGDERNLMLIIMVALLAISVIYIYFTMRSKMINDVYNIGVYRELGGSRAKIVSKYAIDSLVISTFTTLLGYIIFSFVYGYIAEAINALGGDMQRISIYPSTYILVVVIYAFNVIFGILPVLMLLQKTPAEIISKYDI